MGASNWHYLTVDEVVRETENAFLVEIEGEQHWIPKSQIAKDDLETMEVGDLDSEIAVTEWIAREKGLLP